MKSYSNRNFCVNVLSFTTLFSPWIGSTSFAKSNYFLSVDLINLYLLKISPIKKKFPLLELQSVTPFLFCSAKGQRLFFNSDVVLLINSQAPVKGKLSLNSSFYYDPLTYRIYLKDPTIDELSLDVLKIDEKLLLNQLNPLIAQLFNNQLIYELSKSDIQLLKKPPSAIEIVEGGILFKFD